MIVSFISSMLSSDSNEKSTVVKCVGCKKRIVSKIYIDIQMNCIPRRLDHEIVQNKDDLMHLQLEFVTLGQMSVVFPIGQVLFHANKI
jgi:hypothetical protein